MAMYIYQEERYNEMFHPPLPYCFESSSIKSKVTGYFGLALLPTDAWIDASLVICQS